MWRGGFSKPYFSSHSLSYKWRRTSPGKKLDLSGKWTIVELPDMPDDYLDLTPEPHVLIAHVQADRFQGHFQFGAQQGEIDGRITDTWTNSAMIAFTFVGTDEGDEIRGGGEAMYDGGKGTITGTMRYHQGDDLEFVWKRIVTRRRPTRR